ncbi:MAG: serine/threonine-protein kinase [Mariniblastus sp.]
MNSAPDHCPRCGLAYETNSSNSCPNCLDDAQTLAPNKAITDHDALDATVAPLSKQLAPTQTNNRSGDSFSKYEIVSELARGGMGVVYKAKDRQLNRIVALKMILGGRFSSPEEMQRFQVESEAAAKLDHPGIVPVFEAGQHDGQAFLAMKYIGGGSLADRIEDFRDQRQAASLVSAMADAVFHAHQRGILHRDLKPANVLIDENDQPLITDLGLAKSTANESNLTNTGAVLGTPSYMPPEQASGKSVTTAADIYSIGAMLYELLTGQPPHRGGSALETVLKVLSEPIKPVRTINADIDRDLALICMNCLHTDPDSRYSTAKDLSADLDSWMAGDAISIKPSSIAKRTAQWVRHNQGIFYVIMLITVGLMFALPLIFSVLGVLDEVSDIYANTEDDPLPLIYSFKNIPVWVSAVCGTATFLIWPALGMLVTLVTRPKTIRSAALNGSLVAGAMSMLIAILIGWAIFSVASQANTNDTVQALARNVWPEEGSTEDVKEFLVKKYPTLADEPYDEKVNFISNRVFADGVASGPKVMGGLAFALLLIAAPTIFGSVIAKILIERKQRWWFFGPRYFAAWLFSFVTIGMTFALITNGQVNNRPMWERQIWQQLLWVVPPALLTFLILRRWRKKPPIENH